MNNSRTALRPKATKRHWLMAFRRVTEIAMTVGQETVSYWTGCARARRRRGHPSSAAHVRIALERLGPTFIKLGQVLASQVDALPDAVHRELSALLDHAVAVPYEAIAREIFEAYGRPVGDVFAAFHTEPIASASISQVHEAVLAGRRVAVKVRRPGVVPQVELDLTVLRLAAKALQRASKLARRHDLVAMASQVANMVRAELDFEAEAANADQIRLALAGDAGVVVPLVYIDMTRPNVLVMEYVDGIPLSDPARLATSGQDRRRIATTVMSAALSMIDRGRFHCDLHSGNVLGLYDGRVAIVDYGACGTAGKPARAALVTLLTALATADHRLLSQGALGFMVVTRPYDDDKLAQRLAEILCPLASAPLQTISVGRALLDLVKVMQTYGLRLRPDVALVVKAVITAEATAKDLHTDASFAEVLVSFMAKRRDAPVPALRSAQPASRFDLDLRTHLDVTGTTDEEPRRLSQIGA